MGLEHLDYIQDAHANYPARIQALKNRLVNYTNKVWHDLSETLALNSSKPVLPGVPRLDLIYGSGTPLGFNGFQGFFNPNYQIASGTIELRLANEGYTLIRIDLDRSVVLNFCANSSYHQRLLEILASIILGKAQDELVEIASEFFLLCEIERLEDEYIKGLTAQALDKVRQQKQELDAKAKAKTHPGWDDVILPVELKEDLQTYCEILRRHQHYAEQGVTVPKGLLFVGPPGTGKTQTAKILSGEAGLIFLSLSTADAKVGWIGWSAKKIKEIFDEAREKAPALIWLDELDALCPPRGKYLDCLSQEATAELLTQFDGLHSNGQAIFVVAATNRLDMVDGAVLSRFTQHIEIELPGAEERMALLRLFLAKTPLAENGSAAIEVLARLALATEGKSGRDLKNLVDKARMRAIKRNIRARQDRPLRLEESDFDACPK
jgi:AAA+ superfamily predicted ATPase